MASRSVKTDLAIFGRAAVTTIGAASFFQRTTILQVTTNALRVLDPGMFLDIFSATVFGDGL